VVTINWVIYKKEEEYSVYLVSIKGKYTKKTGESCIPFMKKLADHFQYNLNNKTTMIYYFKEPTNLVLFALQSDKKTLFGYFLFFQISFNV